MTCTAYVSYSILQILVDCDAVFFFCSLFLQYQMMKSVTYSNHCAYARIFTETVCAVMQLYLDYVLSSLLLCCSFEREREEISVHGAAIVCRSLSKIVALKAKKLPLHMINRKALNGLQPFFFQHKHGFVQCQCISFVLTCAMTSSIWPQLIFFSSFPTSGSFREHHTVRIHTPLISKIPGGK